MKATFLTITILFFSALAQGQVCDSVNFQVDRNLALGAYFSSLSDFQRSRGRDDLVASYKARVAKYDAAFDQLADSYLQCHGVQLNKPESIRVLNVLKLITSGITRFTVNVTWDDSSTGEDAYIVERAVECLGRCEGGDRFVKVAELPANSRSYMTSFHTEVRGAPRFRVRAIKKTIITGSEFTSEASDSVGGLSGGIFTQLNTINQEAIIRQQQQQRLAAQRAAQQAAAQRAAAQRAAEQRAQQQILARERAQEQRDRQNDGP
ncbi:MAG: hypothetical protein AAF203_04625 [Pseudomonadota bacterium]